MIIEPMMVVAVLLGVIATLFAMNRHPRLGKLFRVVPLLVFAYFVPTILSNTGIIPLESPAYGFVKKWLLPASLLLLTLSVDIPGICKLGPKVLILFFGATGSIILGAPIAYALTGWFLPADLGDEAWKGLAALSGSWIGGGANFIAIGESVGATDSTISMMVIVDVAVANVWMAALLYFAGREEKMDGKIRADRSSLVELRKKLADYQKQVSRPINLPDLLLILALAMGGTAVSTAIASRLPDVGQIINGFTWVVLLVTTLGVVLSLTPCRKLEGAGASTIGSVFLYLLVAVIGAQGEFRKVLDAPALVAVGAVWMALHAAAMLALRRWLRAPIFYVAVASQANVGGAASAPIVASAFHPALAPVGVLLAVLGYVVGTYGGLVCAFLLRAVKQGLY
jgi:uncharacterized membrane protein